MEAPLLLSSPALPVSIIVAGILTYVLSHLSGLSHLYATSSVPGGVSAYKFAEICVLLYVFVGSVSLKLVDSRPVTDSQPLTEASGWLMFLLITTGYLLIERLVLGILLNRPKLLAVLPPRTREMKTMYERGFTRISIFWLLAAFTHRQALEDIYATAAIASITSFIVFNAVLLLDTTAHRRLAAHVGIPFAAFGVANLVVHGLPCLLVNCKTAISTNYSSEIHKRLIMCKQPPHLSGTHYSTYTHGVGQPVPSTHRTSRC